MLLDFLSISYDTWLILMWVAVAIIAIIVELQTTDLSSIWATLGGIVAMIVAFFCHMWWVQLLVFIVITLLGLFLIKPYVKRYIKRNEVKTNSDALVGKVAIVTEDIKDGLVGAVRLEGKEWSALARNPEDSLEKDSKVEVLAIEGVKLIVKAKE